MPIVAGDPREAGRELGRIVATLQSRYRERDRIARIRRALLFRDPSQATAAEMGTYVPSPFDQSALIYKYMGDLTDAAVFIANILSQNPPFFVVDPVIIGNRDEEKIRKIAEDEQNFLNAEWWALTRQSSMDLQRATAWSQTVDGVGWYYSVPRDHDFGLPSRELFEEYTDDEIGELIQSGRALRTVVEGKDAYTESADIWMKRRKEEQSQSAIAGDTLFTLSALQDPTVYVDRDQSGIGIGLVQEEVPMSVVGPGSEMAMMAADMLGDPAWGELGMRVDPESKQIVQGIGQGHAEENDAPGENTVTLNRFYTRDDITYSIGNAGGAGRPIFHTKHQLRRVPLEPVPYFDTGDAKPEQKYIPALDGVFAFTPIVNQTFTFLCSMGAYNAFPRWAIQGDADRVPPDENGNPQVVQLDKTIGLDPEQVATIGGTLTPITAGDPGLLLNLMSFFLAKEQDVRPSDAERGSGTTSGPAWNIRLQDANAQRARKSAQDSHARALENVAREIWIPAIRFLKDATIGFLTAPGERSTREGASYLTELKPKDLIHALQVVQSSNTIEEKAVLAQVGESRRQQGFIDDFRLVKEFYERPNPRLYVLDMYVQAVQDAVLMGPNDRVPEGSLLMDIAMLIRGIAVQRVIERVPNAALAVAEFQAVQDPSLMQGSDSAFNRGSGGPTSQAAGVRPPGVGAPVQQAALPR